MHIQFTCAIIHVVFRPIYFELESSCLFPIAIAARIQSLNYYKREWKNERKSNLYDRAWTLKFRGMDKVERGIRIQFKRHSIHQDHPMGSKLGDYSIILYARYKLVWQSERGTKKWTWNPLTESHMNMSHIIPFSLLKLLLFLPKSLVFLSERTTAYNGFHKV